MSSIVITGASSGIGKALYEKFKRHYPQYNVVGVSRRGPDIELDLTQPLPTSPLITDSVELLINCAGALFLNEDDPKYVFSINFWAAFQVFWNLLPNYTNGACIINIASVSGLGADPDTPLYGAAKAALISLTKSYAKKFAPVFRVNCISPGFYKTNLVPGKLPKDLFDTIPLEFVEKPKAIYPVVKMIWKTKYMTGSNIIVDGGVSL